MTITILFLLYYIYQKGAFMKIIVEQSNLSKALNIVLKAISTRTTKEILKCIYINAHDNAITMISNDLNIGIEMTIPANVIKSGKIAIDGRIFGDIIKKLPSEAIEIEEKNNKIHINCLNSDFYLTGHNTAEFSVLPIVSSDQKIVIDKYVLADMISQTIFATSNDENRPILNGALFDISNDKMTMVAIDLYRVALKKINFLSDADCHLVVPAKALNELLKIILADNNNMEVSIYKNDKFIKYSIGNVVLIARLLEGNFINYEKIIPTEYKTKITCSKTELYQAIDRASLIVNQTNNTSLLFEIKDDYLNITSNTDSGSAQEKVNIELEGPNLKIGFNPKYWLDVLKVIESDNVVVEMTTSTSPCIIKSEEDDNYIYLLLPVRIAN